MLTLTALGISLLGMAQKPKKTHDYQKFAKKMVLYMNGDVKQMCPNKDAIAYIAEKTGRSADAVKEETAANCKTLVADVKFMNDNGIYRVVESTELKVKQESPVKIADILLHCKYKGDEYTITLTNCVQTNLTWVPGDGATASGPSVDDIVARNNEKKEKGSGLMAKLEKIEEQQERFDSINAANTVEPVPPYQYFGQTRTSNFANPVEQYFDFSTVDRPLRGYIIAKDGTRTDCVIKNQAPEDLQRHSSTLLIYNHAYGEAGYEEDETTNFKQVMMKESLRAFYVGGNLYVNDGEQWSILMREGAIRKIVRLVPAEKDGKTVYLVGKILQKLNGPLMNESNLALTFKNTMSDWVKENPELAEKIKNKEDGYRWTNSSTVIHMYNQWYEEQFPEQAPYVFKPQK